jgi:predicted RecB family nuclease
MPPANPSTTMSADHARAPKTARRRPGRDWVSKTDLTRYLRCPFAFVQVDRGMLTEDQLFDPISRQLIDDGVDFHEQVLATAVPMPDMPLADAFTTDVTLLGVPVLRNPALKLLGAPDGVICENGALLPIEIKSHKDVRRTDLLELAFYWLLLEPLRTRKVTPSGLMILRRDGIDERVPVELDAGHFAEVTALIKQVRQARRKGVRPRVCGCPACRGPLREQVSVATRRGRDLTMIWGVGRRYATALEEFGIDNYEALIDSCPPEIVAQLRDRRLYVSADQVEQWRAHAQAYRESREIIFGPRAPVGESFIAFDLEYDPMNPFIWLIGILINTPERRELRFLWSSSPKEERENLLDFAELVRAHPDVPVLTWAGTMADIPQLQAAAARHGLSRELAVVHQRHLDLFMHAVQTLRLPTPEFSLEEVAGYFGIPKTSTVRDGFEAQNMFLTHQRSRSEVDRERIREQLIAYNRDDLEMLAGTHQAIEILHAAEPAAFPISPVTSRQRAA